MTVIDEFLKDTPAAQRKVLKHIRNIIRAQVPTATEVISYGIPVFKYKGKYLIGFSGYKNHMSIFPGSAPIVALQDRLNGFTCSKGTVQFTLDNPLPDALLHDIVDLCLQTID